MTTAKRIALVTGANKAIGLEISRNLSQAGCTVLLGARNAERGRQAVRTLEQSGLSDVHFIEIDLTSQEMVTAAAQAIEARYGRLAYELRGTTTRTRTSIWLRLRRVVSLW